jgi:hypothetical protein
MMDKQPTLHLMHGSKTLSLEHLLSFYKKLTGRDPTPEQIDEAKRMLEERQRHS